MNPQTYHFTLPPTSRPDNVQIPEVWYPDIAQYYPNCTTQRVHNPITGIKAIIIHATDGFSSDGAVSVMRAANPQGSWHWLVPDENEDEHGQNVWKCAPESLAAWHVRNAVSHPDLENGRKRINHWSLGIEIVNRLPNDPFSDWQVKATADIVRYCWAKYPNLKHVISHAKIDPTRRTDPGPLFPWDDFKNKVLNTNFDDLIVHQSIIDNKKANWIF